MGKAQHTFRIGRGIAFPINGGLNTFFCFDADDLGDTYAVGDIWLNPNTGAITKWNGTAWLLFGSSTDISNLQAVVGTALGTTTFSSNNYIADGQDLIQALGILDTALKNVVNGLNPRGFAIAMTEDPAFDTSVAGPVPIATEPNDYEGTAGTFTSMLNDGDVMFNTDGTRWVKTGTDWIKTPLAAPNPLSDRDTFAVQLDLPAIKNQEVPAVYIWRASEGEFIMYGKTTSPYAGALSMSGGYAAVSGGSNDAPYQVDTTDTVQSAMQKVEGATINQSLLVFGTANRSALNLGTLATDTGAITATETIKSIIEKLATRTANVLTAIGISANALNLGAFGFNEASIGTSETIKSALEKLSSRSVDLIQGGAGADVSSTGVNETAKFFVAVKDTVGDKRAAFEVTMTAYGTNPTDYDDSGIAMLIESPTAPAYTVTLEADGTGKPKITIGGLSGTTSARIKRIDF